MLEIKNINEVSGFRYPMYWKDLSFNDLKSTIDSHLLILRIELSVYERNIDEIPLETEINSMKRVLSVIEELSELREKVLVGITLLDEVVDSIYLGDSALHSSI
jgi:hypothetical protein